MVKGGSLLLVDDRYGRRRESRSLRGRIGDRNGCDLKGRHGLSCRVLDAVEKVAAVKRGVLLAVACEGAEVGDLRAEAVRQLEDGDSRERRVYDRRNRVAQRGSWRPNDNLKSALLAPDFANHDALRADANEEALAARHDNRRAAGDSARNERRDVGRNRQQRVGGG